MKQSVKVAFTGLLLINSVSYALNPVQGWYAGVFLGVSNQPNTQFTLNTPIVTPKVTIPTDITGTIKHSVLGSVGGEVGYRCNNFRVEAEVLYNNNPYKTLTINGFTVKSPSSSSTLRMKGAVNSGAILANGFYDIYTPNEDGWSQIVPYVGGGLGYAYVQNNIEFYYNDVLLKAGDITEGRGAAAGQGIVGVSYFLDDFTTLGIDFRYLTTAIVKHSFLRGNEAFNSRFTLYSINLLFNGAFDFG